MIRVLLVEDSRSTAAYIEALLRAETDFEVLPTATDGAAGVDAAKRLKPDVILMDLDLPAMDGVAAIEEIMVTSPCPIVVLSAYIRSPDSDRTFESLEAGAVDVLAKPTGLTKPQIQGFRERLAKMVRLMSRARVVQRWRRGAGSSRAKAPGSWVSAVDPRIVLLGASTGGPAVIDRLLRAVPPPFPLPIVIAQHTIPGFEHSLARWLSASGHTARVVTAPGPISPSEVAVAAAHLHLAVRAGHFELMAPGSRGPVPSADVLFQSAAEAYGRTAVAFLLTGMGDDGARGLAALRVRGALTITQRASTCVIDGMPAAARAAGGSSRDLSPDEMAEVLRRIASRPR